MENIKIISKNYTALTFLGMWEFGGLKNTRWLTDCYHMILIL